MTKAIVNRDLFRRVSVADYNARQGERGSPTRVRDVNGNRIVDHEDIFSPRNDVYGNLRNPSYLLHEMCMERRPVGSAWSLSEKAIALIQRFHRTMLWTVDPDRGNRYRGLPTGSYEVVSGEDIGALVILGRGYDVSGLLTGEADLVLGPDGALSVYGSYDPELQGCNYNRTLEVHPGRGLRRDSLRLDFENATGRHVAFWDLRDRTIDVRR
ncbi:MAG TPA: hypothetical protein VLJ37_10910 [bacterium]|nr:hypothetical protein [bacterium]